MSFSSTLTGQLHSSKFTSLTSEQLTMAMIRVTDDEYMLQNHMIVDQEEDCFFKLDQHLNQLKIEESKQEEVKEGEIRSKIAVLHSRYASRKNTMRDN